MSNPINKGILYLSVPIVIGNIAQTLYGLVDVYWIGQLGTLELAAITLVNPVIQMLINTGMGMTTAASIIVSHKIGTNDDDKNQNYSQSYIHSYDYWWRSIIFYYRLHE